MAQNEYLKDFKKEPKEFSSHYKPFYAVIFISAFIIFWRLWYLQITNGQKFQEFSKKNQIKEMKIPAPRGLIIDRNGNILVENLPGFEATISPHYTKQLKTTAKEIGKILDIPPSKIINKVKESRIKNGPFHPVKIKENLSLNEILKLKLIRLNHPELNINEVILRHYPLNENGAQLFGYVGEISKKQIEVYNKKYRRQFLFEQGDIIGKSGLEEVWETKIRGQKGTAFVEVDARGREMATQSSFFDLKPKKPISGLNLVLTIDIDIQKAAFKAMNQQRNKKSRIGSLVAMKSNGEILAWINSPFFDPNQFSIGISNEIWTKLINDPFKPLRNKVIQDHYAPGSAFKPFVALAALQEKIITPNTLIYSPGSFRFGRRVYHDHARHGHGNITLYDAIERSSNVFFYKMGIALGIDRIAKYSKLFGFGRKTNIKMSNEATGLMPTKAWKLKSLGEEWQPGENLSNAIGQGFVLTTALQMVVAYNAIGTEGKVYKPFLVKKFTNNKNEVIQSMEPHLILDISQKSQRKDHVIKEGIPKNQSKETSNKNSEKDSNENLKLNRNPNERGFIEKRHFKVVKEAMRRVTNGSLGTARWWKIPGIEIAGKTGTSQVRSFSAEQIYDKCEERPVHERHHGWFIGYAPVDVPEITVAVLTEHSCHGSTGSAPVVRDVILAYMKKYHPKKLKKPSKKFKKREKRET